ncbi:carbohydrate ABC transporter permease [Cohnella rhizosphaerae]|uniref:Sugar ABC transporter permease n=1 Tax=Cohnella rhizosphaerae TaxID=1457232 RepID=A0A9X4KPM8_9BACL|nr:sugar ABC transporter permease [Cohnella rhizosphaerae]MDG0808427.1 sugar ABC transporter permease [Cohnella rhizosphaerae]
MVPKMILKNYPILFIVPAVVLYTVFSVVPSFVGLAAAFTDWSTFYLLKPTYVGLQNFKDLFESTGFLGAIRHTLVYTALHTVFVIALGYGLAIILNNQVKFKNAYRVIIFSPVVINPLVISLVFSALYNPTNGPINTFLRSVGLGSLAQNWLTEPKIALYSVIIMGVWVGLGSTVVIFLAGLQSVSADFYESATIDGAGGLKKFRYITLPLTMHALTINTLLVLISGLNVFGEVYGLTNGGPNGATEVFGTFIFANFSQGMYGYAAAAGLVFTVVVSISSFTLLGLFKKLEVEY